MNPARAAPDLVFSLDGFGWPVVTLPGRSLSCHLLPATKVLYEYYLGGSPGAGWEGYDEMLALSPRVSWRTARAETVNGVLLAAARPDDALPLARWLGPGHRLPTADEWLQIDAALDVPAGVRETFPPGSAIHPCAAAVLALTSGGRGPTWRRCGLLEGGFLEWVTCPDGTFGVFGRPPSSVLPNTLNPQRDRRPQVPVGARRRPAFGFRLVCPHPTDARP